MRTADLPPELKAVYAKVLAFQAEPGERFFALCESSVSRTAEPRIIVRVLNEAGNPQPGVSVTQEWPDGHESPVSDAHGEVAFFLGPGSRFVPPRGGPHRIYVGRPESLNSDLVYSLGSPHGQFLTYVFTFNQTTL
jgi:hypothetical protein